MSWAQAVKCDAKSCHRAVVDFSGEQTFSELVKSSRLTHGWTTELTRGEWRNYCPDHSPVQCDIRGCGEVQDEDHAGWQIGMSKSGYVTLCPRHNVPPNLLHTHR